MQQILHELIAVVINSMKELLGIGVVGCGGKSVKDCISLLMMLHLLLRNLHTRGSQVAFSCGIRHIITPK